MANRAKGLHAASECLVGDPAGCRRLSGGASCDVMPVHSVCGGSVCTMLAPAARPLWLKPYTTSSFESCLPLITVVLICDVAFHCRECWASLTLCFSLHRSAVASNCGS